MAQKNRSVKGAPALEAQAIQNGRTGPGKLITFGHESFAFHEARGRRHYCAFGMHVDGAPAYLGFINGKGRDGRTRSKIIPNWRRGLAGDKFPPEATARVKELIAQAATSVDEIFFGVEKLIADHAEQMKILEHEAMMHVLRHAREEVSALYLFAGQVMENLGRRESRFDECGAHERIGKVFHAVMNVFSVDPEFFKRFIHAEKRWVEQMQAQAGRGEGATKYLAYLKQERFDG